MLENEILIETPDGAMPTFITHPEEGGPFPTVIFFMDALGIREELRDMARRIGTVGYYVMLANLYYRDGGPSFDPKLLPTRGPDPEMQRLNFGLTHAHCLADTKAQLDLARTDIEAADPVGVVGYCMGGRHAFAAAGTFPDRVQAMVSLHGGFQVTDKPELAASAGPSDQRRVLFRLRRRRPAVAAEAPPGDRRGAHPLGRHPSARDLSRCRPRLHLPPSVIATTSLRRSAPGSGSSRSSNGGCGALEDRSNRPRTL